MSSQITRHSKEKQISEIRTVLIPITARRKNYRPLHRWKYLWNVFVLASSVVWGVIILRYDPLSSRRSGSKTSEDWRQNNLWRESYLYYQPTLRRIARLGTQAHNFVVVQISRSKPLEKITSQLSCHLQRLHLPRIFNDPSPTLFLIACLMYALAITAFRHVHRKDRYQDFILWHGVAIAMVCAWLSGNFMLELKSYLACSVVFALVLSSLVHRVLGLFAGQEVQEQED